MPSDAALRRLATAVGRALLASNRMLVTAESCTAGWVAKCLTDIAGSSRWFEAAYVTYSDEAKRRDLGVSRATLARDGAVSESTVRVMAHGALKRAGADVAVAISGIAGPDGGSPGKPVGTVWFALAVRRGRTIAIQTRRKRFRGDRETVRRASVEVALEMVLRAHPVRSTLGTV